MPGKALFADTDEAAERVMIELARQTPPWKEFEQVAAANEAARCFAMAGLRSRYATEDEGRLRMHLIALMLDRETLI